MYFSYGRRLGRILMITMITCLLLTAPSTAANLLIHWGNDAAQQWVWAAKQSLPDGFYELVTSQEQAQKVIKRLPVQLQSEAFAHIDFTRQAAIVAYLGEARGGYAVDIHSMQISGNQVWIHISRRAPAADEVTTMILTYPLAVKAIPLSDLPANRYHVRFVDQRGVLLAQAAVGAPSPAPVTVALGKDAMLRWKWNQKNELPGSLLALVTSRKDAQRMAGMLPDELRSSAFKGINFKKQAALIAYLGAAPNNGYAIDIHSAKINGNSIEVKVSRRSPKKNEIVLQTISHPMKVKALPLAKLPRQPYTVRFIDQKGMLLQEQPVGMRSMYHTVRAGETLWYIAWLYGVQVDDVMHWNGLTPTSVIWPGQIIRVYR